MTETLVPICFGCERFRGLVPDAGWSCAAFDRIPTEILASVVDHRKPVEGDRGLAFVPRESDLPPLSEAQRRAMWAAAAGHGPLGIPTGVGREFVASDPGGKLPATAKDMSKTKWGVLKRLFGEWLSEEEAEPEHRANDIKFVENEHLRDKGGKFATVYHGSREIGIERGFKPGQGAYTTTDPVEAAHYAMGGHLGGSGKGEARVHTLNAHEGSILDIDQAIAREFEQGGDPDTLISKIIKSEKRAGKAGARYLRYHHPSFQGNKAQEVLISLYPHEDLSHGGAETAESVLNAHADRKMEVGADERPWDRKGRAASIAFVTGDGRVLLVKRSAKDDHKPGEWCLPGGKAEGDEGFYNCALREAGEEVGTDGWEDEGGRELLRTRTPNDWEHVTYAIPVRDAFVPRLSDEHDDWTWAHPDALPDPVHPGVKKCVDGVILDGRAEDVENPEGRLSATTREDISAGRRKSMPESAFLEPARRKYPVQELRDGKWTYTCALLLAAGRRARMEGDPKLAARADAIRAREFPEAADGEFREGDHPRRSDGKFGSGGGGPPSGTEHLKKAYEEGSVPEGWYTHGRAMRQDLKTGNVIQSTRDLDVSHQYAGSKGSVWYLRPKADARTLDLSGTSSGDIGRVADAAVEDYESGKLPWADDFDNSRDLRGLSREEKADALREVVEESFSPGNIVDSAGAYDNPDWTKWLKKRFKVDFVHVPDGSVTINPKAVEAVKVRGAEDVADPDRRVIGKPGTPSEREPTPEGALDGFDAIARVLDLALDGAADGLAFDALLGLAEDKEPERWKDDVGRMHISDSVISKAVVSPYLGKEINRVMEGEEGWVPLEAERTYRLLRHPDELRKAAKTFQGLPIVWKHVPTSAEDHPTDIVVGATGTNAKFDGTDLTNDLVFWPKYAVEAVEDESKKNLSCGYGYKADMTPGSYDGHDYDGIMRDLVGNHLAQVERPRVPGSKVGGDEASEDGFDRLARILAAA